MPHDPNQLEQFGTMRSTVEMAKGCANLFSICVNGVASTFYPFVRRSFGPRFFGLIQLSGLPISWLFAVGTCTPETIWPFTYFTSAYVLARIVQGVSTGKAMKTGYYHSRYNGYPLICKYIPVSEANAKAFWEPMFVLLIGIGIVAVTQHPFGAYVFIGGIAMMIDHGQLVDYQRRMAMEIRDQELFNQAVARQLEKMRN